MLITNYSTGETEKRGFNRLEKERCWRDVLRHAVHFVVLRNRSHWQVENLANVKSVCLRSGQGWGTFGLAVKLCVGMLAPRVSAWGYVLTWPPAVFPVIGSSWVR